MVLADTTLKSSVCDKVGSSTALTTEDLREWATYCTVTSGVSIKHPGKNIGINGITKMANLDLDRAHPSTISTKTTSVHIE